MIEVRNFVGGMDKDSSLYDVAKGFYLDGLNVTKDAISGNNDLAVTNVVGNRIINYTYPAGRSKVIGSFGFQLRNTVIFFRWNANRYHGIYEASLATRTITKIFENKTDSDDVDVLGFTENGKITSVNVYPRDEGDLLFFLDSLGRPTEIDIALFKTGEYTPVTRAILDKGKMPPLSPPQVVYDNDTTRRVNNTRNKLFRFKYRWIYDDFEKSTFSPISIVPLPVSILSDIYTNIITNNNVIRMTANSGGKNVKSVEIAMSYVEKTNDWSDFQSVEVIDKTTFALSVTTSIRPAVFIYPYRAVMSFSGTVIAGTAINIYATQLPSTQVLIGTYTTVAGDTIADVGAALLASVASFGIADNQGFSGQELTVYLDDTTYSFSRIDILPPADPQLDDIDFSFAFYNDSTYPDIDIQESIQLFDYVPDKANAQEMPNGNVLAYAGITEGYDKDTVEDAIVTVGTIAAGSGGSVGSLNAIITVEVDTVDTRVVSTFSGIPATGTIVNFKLRLKSDSSILLAGTYTTMPGDSSLNVAGALNAALDASPLIFDSAVRGGGFAVAASFSTVLYEFSVLEIIPPTTASATNSTATWKWSTERNIGRLYFDQKGKTNGILYTDKVTFPAYAENGSQQPLIPFINYKINDVPPLWAYSMQFAFTKENTQYIFWQSVSVNKSESAYIYLDVSSFISNATKKPTTSQVLSYAFQDGDRLRILRDTDDTVYADTYDAAIEGLVVDPVINSIATTGTFLKIKSVAPLSTLSAALNYVIEIYRPAQQVANNDNQVYFEFGRQYAIIDPTLSTRSHAGQVTDQVPGIQPAEYTFYEGDAYFRARTIATSDVGYSTFNVMDRNFVDFYISAVSDVDGRPNIIDINARRQYYSTLIRFGQAYQANTNINGLNRFYPNNFDEYDYNYGDITRLKVRDRYMKVFQKFKIGTVPLYSQLTKDPNGNNVQVVTDKLLNPIQYRIGNFGLSAPESLASWHFADYGCDVNKGIIWRDSNDGVYPISELYKIGSWAAEELPLRTGNSKIYGVINPKSNQYIISLESYTVPVPYFNIQATELNSITGTAWTIVSSGAYTVDWGDGTVDSFAAGTTNPTHTYASPYTGDIKLYTDDFSLITAMTITGETSGIDPQTDSLSVLTEELSELTGLTYLSLKDSIFVDGIVTDLPVGLTYLVIENTNLSGNVSDLPAGLLHVNITGNNTLTGLASGLPEDITFLLLWGANTLTGDLNTLPRLLALISIHGNNTLSGNVTGLPPNGDTVEVLGHNTVSGNITGFPATYTYIVFVGFNTITGDIVNMPPNIVTFQIEGYNTVTGDIADIKASCRTFRMGGLNTVFGDLAFTPDLAAFSVVSEGSSINAYTAATKAWTNGQRSIIIRSDAGGLSTTDADNLLIELAAQVTIWGYPKVVIILGASSPRSAASDAAVATLVTRGVTITTAP